MIQEHRLKFNNLSFEKLYTHLYFLQPLNANSNAYFIHARALAPVEDSKDRKVVNNPSSTLIMS